jgi:hypothetical protein
MFTDFDMINYTITDARWSPNTFTINTTKRKYCNYDLSFQPNQKKSSISISMIKFLYGGSPIYEVIKLRPTGECTILYVRRRDLIKANYLQPRDLRRIDPQMALSRTLQGQTLLVKERIMIINIGGVKILCSSEKALSLTLVVYRAEDF